MNRTEQNQTPAKKQSSFRTKAVRAGGYSALASIIVIAIAVAVNLFVGQLPAKFTKPDVTGQGLYTVSEQTTAIVSGLTQDVIVYVIVPDGSEDYTLTGLLERYSDLSDKLHVEYIDPVLYPTFAQQYTDEQIYANSMVVVSGDRHYFISYADVYLYDYSNYYTTGTYSTSFDGENCLTQAIDYVTSENLPKIYTLTGHGEAELASTLTTALTKQNMMVESLTLITAEAVPEDADCVFILAPTSDISADEAARLIAYAEAGGNILLITNYTETDMPNLTTLTKKFGMTMENALVIEGDGNRHLPGYPHYVLPAIQNHTLTEPLVSGKYYVLMPLAHVIRLDEAFPDSLKVTELLNTSDAAYGKTNAYSKNSVEKEDGDPAGPFTLGAAAALSTGSGEANFVWYSTAALLDDNMNQVVSGGNHDLFINTLGFMCGHESSIAIHAKSLDIEYLNMTESASNTLSFLMVGVIPALFVIVGVVVWIRRSRR